MSNHHVVTLLTRATCGSCARVEAQIRPVVAAHGATLVVEDVDADVDLRAEFGDRTPVVLVDDIEIACWEIDTEDLIAALA
ncbi:MAG: glutaredoxin family protein [Corynebacterium sp.]|nr:glutaredoxin family protein [Corynebacterium sp.]